MTAAIFGLVGVVIGSVLSALLTYFLQESQDLRRWSREDERRWEQERLALYRDFVNELDRAHGSGEIDGDKVSAMLAEMSLLSSMNVYNRAQETAGGTKAMLEELRENSENPDPAVVRDVMNMRTEHLYRFNMAVRGELGVVTDWERMTLEPAEPVFRGWTWAADKVESEQRHPWWRGVFRAWRRRVSGGRRR